jgi:bifunctional DNA-binding transcriptional regulator/antitoxin component of YhaV-PrlF toxin-antitoxin module
MESIYLNHDGRITIPKLLRKKFGIKPKTRLFFCEEFDGLKIIPITPKVIDENIGFMKTEGKLLKALMREKK